MKNKRLFIGWLGMLTLAIGLGLWLGRLHQSDTRNEGARTERVKDGLLPGGAGSPSQLVPEAMRLFDQPAWAAASPPQEPAAAPPAYQQVQATAVVGKPNGMDLSRLCSKDHLILPVGEAQQSSGVVNLVSHERGGWVRVAGNMGIGGTFWFNQGPRGERSGMIVLQPQGLAYQLESRSGALLLHRRSVDSVLCQGMPYRHHPEAAAPSSAPPPAAIGAIPNLDSRPEATGVLYLDFDGEIVTDPSWNGGSTIVAQPAVVNNTPISTAQMTDVWARVAEDFKPLKVTVTTMRSRYDNAPAGERMMAVITPSQSWYSAYVGGVAFIGSYRGPFGTYAYSSTIPCWVFNNYDTSDMALTVSHELGHTVGLRHDGLLDGTTYYSGHGLPPTSWGPIMGAPWDRVITQWSIGDYRSEYSSANNQEDDLAIMGNLIGQPLGVPALPADDAADTPAGAPPLNFDRTVNISGLISPHITGSVSKADVDYYKLETGGGPVTLTAMPGTVDPDLDIQMELRDASDHVLLTSLPQDDLGATLNTTVAQATYYIVLRGRSRYGVPAQYDYGYSAYGCNGPYTIKGTVPQLAVLPTIIKEPVSLTVGSGSKAVFAVTVSSNVPVTYLWYKDDAQMTGKTGASLTIASAQAADAAKYKVVVTNAAGSVPSDEVTLQVRFKPSISTPPSPPLTTVATGANVSYTVVAGGSTPLSFQWKKDNVTLPGENSPTLDLGLVDWFDQGGYTVVVSNDQGSVTSAAVKLAVNSPPVIKVQPPALKPLIPGGTGNVAVTAVGNPPLTYQWFNGSSLLPGATKATYAWKDANSAMEGAYTVQVTNSNGTTVSDVMTVDVIDPPKIIVQPTAPAPIASGSPLTLSVTASGDANVPLVYQWQLNTVNISGATSDTYTVASAAWADQGSYRVIVSNPAASVTSKAVVVTLHSPPVIMSPPAAAMKVARNGGATLKVVATGTPALAYQWRKNDVDIPGARAASYTLSHASDATAADYSVIVSNGYGSAPGGTSHVTVENAPAITRAPLALTKPVGGAADFDVVVSGSDTLRYQWQKNSVNIPRATSPTLSLATLALNAAASYRVLVSNDVGTATSAAAKLSVLIPPSVTKPPLAQSLFEYDNVTFTATAAGSPTLAYQWQKDGTNIPGAKSSSLTLNGLRRAHDLVATQEGDYTVVVTNPVGVATSAAAHLTIAAVPPPDLTMMTPYRGVIGSQVLLRGTNLRWTNKVTFNGKAATFVKVNATELILTVPTGATTGPVVVTTTGGSISTADVAALAAPDFTVTKKTENDDFINAKFLTRGFYFLVGDSVENATSEAGDPYFSSLQVHHTIWYRWRPPVTDYYVVDTGGSPFNTFLAVFRGETQDTLSMVGYSSNISIYDEHSTVGFIASKTEDYYIMVDGEYPGYYDVDPLPPVGELALNIYKSLPTNDLPAGAEKAANKGAIRSSVTQGAQASAPAPERTVGGTVAPGSTGSTLLLSPDSETDLNTADVAHASLDFRIETSSGVAEKFSWMVQDKSAKPVFGLMFDAASKAVAKTSADGSMTTTEQVFVPGGEYHLDIQLDRQSHTWGAMLNGIWIIEAEPVSDGASFDKLAACWVAGPGVTNGGQMHFKNVRLTADTAPLAAH